MLTDIYIENYTVVDHLHLNLNAGLSVLSGETGAGKSIIVDAINLALGARLDSKVLRSKEVRCTITLCFNVANITPAKEWLEHHSFNDNFDCIISRTHQQDGRSKITINGKPCPSMLLRELAPLLLVIHSQHQSQSLLEREQQQAYVDRYGKHQDILQTLQDYFSQWRLNQTELDYLKQQATQREEQSALLNYQLEELNQLDLQIDEWQQLHREHQQLHNAKQLIQNLNQAIDLTVENEKSSSTLLLQYAIDQLKIIHKNNPQLSSVIELLNTAAIHIQEAGDELIHYRDALDLSPERLNYIENRLTKIHDLARKHHVTPKELPDVSKSLQHKIDLLDAIDERTAILIQHNQQLMTSYQQDAQKLSLSRQQLAKEISKKITAYMQNLGMQGGEFQVSLETHNETMTTFGNEKISFMIKTNPGQALFPMTKIVSGGELSRISLALQTIFSEKENIPTLIFDEVDVGIGGKTAETVGKLLQSLGREVQVFCITHLPQVAAQGHHHYKVSKSSTHDSTTATIEALNHQQRIEEIARMISGSKITQQTLQYAEELLTS